MLGLAGLAAHAAPFAYISNQGGNNVSVIDTATNTVVATVPVGTAPFGVAVNPTGTFVYVANITSNNVSVIDTATNTVVATIPAGTNPSGVAVNPAGTFAYVTNVNSANVSVINTATNTVVATVPVGASPVGVAVNAAGTFAYVANRNSANVSVIDTATNNVVATVTVGTSPHGATVNPAGTFVYISNQTPNNVSVINTSTNTVVATVPVGASPVGVAFNPAGTFAYVTNFNGASVSVINTATNAVVATVPAGTNPIGVAVNPAGTFAYVANKSSNNISVIDAATNTVVATVPVGSFPVAFGNFIGPAPATVPGAPTGALATAGNAQATVTFTAPASNGGSAITGYSVVSNPAGGLDSNAATTGLSHVVTGLTNGTAYTFTVTATNAVGTGPASAPSNSVTPVTVPGAPTGALATAGNAQATVTFTAPASNGGSAITGYSVVSNPAGGLDSNAATTGLSHVVTGLTNGTAYTFTVTAKNAVGTSAPSAASSSVTPAGVPGAPNMGAATPGNGQVKISFTPPASDGGSPILRYTVTCNPGAVSATGAAPSIVVPGLTNGTTYLCSVAATNAIGTGPGSATTSVTPANNTFTGPTATGTGTATVSFTGGGGGCSFAPQGNGPTQSAFFIPLTGHPKSPPPGSAPPGVDFAQGLLDFVLVGCTPGGSVTLTVTYPNSIAGAQYWKYGRTPTGPSPHWYVLPATIAGTTATFTIADGGIGDDDLAANGTIVDQGGPGLPPAAAAAIPTLRDWAMILMGGLLLMLGMRNLRGAEKHRGRASHISMHRASPDRPA